MNYLEKIDEREIDKKKVVGARVSEVVLSALNMAEEESDQFGYTFSVTKVIEKALNDTLLEIRDTTGIDYYELVKWQKKMKSSYKRLLSALDLTNFTEEVLNIFTFKDKIFTDHSYLTKPNLSASDSVSHSQQGVSSETLKIMKEGKIEHTPSIDLHKEKIEKACTILSHAIHYNVDEHFIHIIHGKGHHLDEGLANLKSQVIHYLKQHPRVLAFCSCPQNKGGTGAVFAYIKHNIDFDLIDPFNWEQTQAFHFETTLKEAEHELVRVWNLALKSQNIDANFEVQGEYVSFKQFVDGKSVAKIPKERFEPDE